MSSTPEEKLIAAEAALVESLVTYLDILPEPPESVEPEEFVLGLRDYVESLLLLDDDTNFVTGIRAVSYLGQVGVEGNTFVPGFNSLRAQVSCYAKVYRQVFLSTDSPSSQSSN